MHTFTRDEAVATNPRVSRPCECYTTLLNHLSTILSSACSDCLSSNNPCWHAYMNLLIMVHWCIHAQSLRQSGSLCSQIVHQNSHRIRIWIILLCMHACMHALPEEELVVLTSHALIALKPLYLAGPCNNYVVWIVTTITNCAGCNIEGLHQCVGHLKSVCVIISVGRCWWDMWSMIGMV